VPVRAFELFARTLIETEPFPVPLPPDRIAIHDTLLPADHGHVLGVDTVIDVPAPPV
jgi:hypothetical protein